MAPVSEYSDTGASFFCCRQFLTAKYARALLICVHPCLGSEALLLFHGRMTSIIRTVFSGWDMPKPFAIVLPTLLLFLRKNARRGHGGHSLSLRLRIDERYVCAVVFAALRAFFAEKSRPYRLRVEVGQRIPLRVCAPSGNKCRACGFCLSSGVPNGNRTNIICAVERTTAFGCLFSAKSCAGNCVWVSLCEALREQLPSLRSALLRRSTALRPTVLPASASRRFEKHPAMSAFCACLPRTWYRFPFYLLLRCARKRKGDL